MKSKNTPMAIIIVTEGKEKIIDLQKLSHLEITYNSEKESITIKTTEETEEIIRTRKQKIIGDNSGPREKPTKKVEQRKSPKNFKKLGGNINNIPIEELREYYQEYKKASTKGKGKDIAKKIGEKYNIAPNTPTVWFSQARRLEKEIPIKTLASKRIKELLKGEHS